MSDIRPFFLSKAPYWQIIHMRQFSPFGRIEVLNKRTYWFYNLVIGLVVFLLLLSAVISVKLPIPVMGVALITFAVTFLFTGFYQLCFKSGYTMKLNNEKTKP